MDTLVDEKTRVKKVKHTKSIHNEEVTVKVVLPKEIPFDYKIEGPLK